MKLTAEEIVEICSKHIECQTCELFINGKCIVIDEKIPMPDENILDLMKKYNKTHILYG